MIKYKYNRIFILLTGFLLVFFGRLVFAEQAPMVVYFTVSSPNIVVGDTFVVKTRISSVNEKINTAEATLFFDSSKLQVQELSTGGSLFRIWPKQPTFSNNTGEISFFGGVPGGFLGKDAEVLKIVFLAKKEGDALLDFRDDIALFLHDGKGTKIGPWVRPLRISITSQKGILPKQQWKDLLSNDIVAPESFNIVLGKDSTLFNGRYFISFLAHDMQSGIDHYEVQEGDGDFVVAHSPYMLKNQHSRSIIKVKALDKAGNERIVVFKYRISFALKTVTIILTSLVLLFIVFVLYSKFLKNR